jgi:uncharacterized protein YutE (UPF0331/DUF86 family)
MKLIKYLIVCEEDGMWEWNTDAEHHSIAVPKMLNSLELRINRLIDTMSEKIKLGMKENDRSSYSPIIYTKIYEIKEEINLHFYILNNFKEKVLKNLTDENKKLSPIMMLKNMESPLDKRKKPLISHMYEHFDNEEIVSKLENSLEKLNNTIKMIEIVKECWDDILNLNELDAEILLGEMKKINEKLNKLDEKLFNAFFVFDDATRGLLQKGVTLKVNLMDVSNRLTDLIFRILIKGVNNYHKSKESVIIEKAINRLHELNLEVEDMNLQVLLDVKMLLDTKLLDNYSYDSCYKKIGEFHSSIKQKIFELESLSYLKNYLPVNIIYLYEILRKKMVDIHEKFIDRNEKIFFFKTDKGITDKITNKNIHELEIYSSVIEDLILECEIGKEYFHLTSKLHKINSIIVSKYFILDLDKLYKYIDIIGSKEFRDFIFSFKTLMIELRKEIKRENENKNKKQIDEKNLFYVGVTTGKTIMINSYLIAIEEILASLGTFMGNTIHVLIREMLGNFPDSSRINLQKSYEETELALKEFNKESFSFSFSYSTSSDESF